MDLNLILLYSKEKGIKTLLIFGYSMLVINWIKKTQQFHNIIFHSLLEEVFRILESLDSFLVHHVYSKCNQDVDFLSKEGFQMDLGTYLILEQKDGEFLRSNPMIF